MNRRRKLLLAAVALLLALNVWHWWPKTPRATSTANNQTVGKSLRVEEFVIHGVSVGKLGPAKRDVFQPKRPVVAKLPPPTVKAPEPPPKTAEELELEAAQAEYAQIRCLGVAFRNNRGQAMLSVGQEIYHVSIGERAGRFVVEKIETNGVQVKDPKTGVGGKINLADAKR